MTEREQKINECVDFLRRNSMLVLATLSPEGPYTSLMGYCCSADGREVYMLSRRESNKWSNLKQTPQVSLLVDDRDGKLEHDRGSIKALTVAGSFVEVSDPEEEKKIMELIAGENPAIAPVFSGPECSIIRVKVSSFLFLNGPEEVFFSGQF